MMNSKSIILLILVSFIFSKNISATGNSEKYLWKPVYKPFDEIAAKMDLLPEKDPQLEILLPLLYEKSLETEDHIVKARYLFWESNVTNASPTALSSTNILLLKNALVPIDSNEYKYDFARIQYYMVNPINNEVSFAEQYKFYLQLLKIFEEYGDYKYQGNIYRRLGILMSELKEYEKAIEFLTKANELYKELGQQYLLLTNMVNLATVYGYIGQNHKAIEILEELLNSKDLTLDTSVLISIYSNLNNVQSNIEKQKFYADKAFNLAKKYKKNPYLISMTRVNKGYVFLSNNILDSALNYFNKAYQFALKNNTSRILIPSLLNLSVTYEKMGKLDKSFYFLKQYHHVKDSILGLDKVSEINRVQSSLAIKQYQNQLIIEQQKNKLRKNQIIITILLSIVLLSIVISVLINLLQQKRITETKLTNEKLQIKNLQIEIDSQNRELSSTTLVLSEKNAILNQLIVLLDKFNRNGELPTNTQKTLKKVISDNINASNEWEKFKLHFENVHPKFFQKLKAINGSLTENDLRLCAYIRIGMTSKQIAQMLSVLPATIKTNRYLLRKKFNLKKNESLENLIRDNY